MMLSSPPLALAAATSASPAASGSRSAPSIAEAISCSESMSERPSEQRRKRSPGRASRVNTSASTDGSVPTAFVIAERCGCRSASSGVRTPLSTSSATSEWSVVTCSRTPSRSRYARESPTWPNEIVPAEASTSAIVTVVPIPAVSGSARERSQTRRFASAMIAESWAASRVSALASSSAEAARSAAISPARAPPMPSAIANSGGSKT